MYLKLGYGDLFVLLVFSALSVLSVLGFFGGWVLIW